MCIYICVFSMIYGNNHSHWLIFFRGVEPPTRYIYIYTVDKPASLGPKVGHQEPSHRGRRSSAEAGRPGAKIWRICCSIYWFHWKFAKNDVFSRYYMKVSYITINIWMFHKYEVILFHGLRWFDIWFGKYEVEIYTVMNYGNIYIIIQMSWDKMVLCNQNIC